MVVSGAGTVVVCAGNVEVDSGVTLDDVVDAVNTAVFELQAAPATVPTSSSAASRVLAHVPRAAEAVRRAKI
jgi:hypothetical protein